MSVQVWHNEQTSSAAGAPWTDWHVLSSLGDDAKYQLALAAHPDGRMHAVAPSGALQLRHNEQTGSQSSAPWTSWHDLSAEGELGLNGLALATHPDGRMHALMAGYDNQLWHNEQTQTSTSAPWTDWHYLSSPGQKAIKLDGANGGVALAGHPDGRMHALMVGLDHQIWHNEQVRAGLGAPWTDWHYLSELGQEATQISIACHPDGRMHAVMAGMDKQIWHNEQTQAGVSAPWTGWHFLSDRGNKANRIALAVHPDGRMHSVMIGIDQQIWHNEQIRAGASAPWTDWHYLSEKGQTAAEVVVACHPDGRLHAVMADLDAQVWHNEQTENGLSAPWSGWHYLSNAGDTATLLALAVHRDGRMHALMAGDNFRRDAGT
jgi:hypothetical protein